METLLITFWYKQVDMTWLLEDGIQEWDGQSNDTTSIDDGQEHNEVSNKMRFNMCRHQAQLTWVLLALNDGSRKRHKQMNQV